MWNEFSEFLLTNTKWCSTLASSSLTHTLTFTAEPNQFVYHSLVCSATDPFCSKNEVYEGKWEIQQQNIILSQIHHSIVDSRQKDSNEQSLTNERLDENFILRLDDNYTHISGQINEQKIQFTKIDDTNDLSIFASP